MALELADVTLDVLGFHCPVPVHETKRILATMSPGEIVLVMADDPETNHKEVDDLQIQEYKENELPLPRHLIIHE